MILGVDLSNHNGELDFESLKNVGVEFAILRTGWGSDYPGQQDEKLREYAGACNSYSIPFGFYHYSYALSVEDAKNEARHCLRLIEELGTRFELPIYIDMEDADGYKDNHGLNPYENGDILTDICVAFCEVIREAGYRAGVYSNPDYFYNVLAYKKLKNYSIWLAHWEVSQPDSNFPCDIWQYTSDFYVDDHRLDGNYLINENILDFNYGASTDEIEIELPIEEPIEENIITGFELESRIKLKTNNGLTFYITKDIIKALNELI